VLCYVVAGAAYDVMVTGEKTEEYRQASQWNQRRLFVRPDSKEQREYTFVRFYHGYGGMKHDNRRMFVAEYLGFDEVEYVDKVYSNGLHVKFRASAQQKFLYRIKIGRVVHIVGSRVSHPGV
jgi:hypothetical protein